MSGGSKMNLPPGVCGGFCRVHPHGCPHRCVGWGLQCTPRWASAQVCGGVCNVHPCGCPHRCGGVCSTHPRGCWHRCGGMGSAARTHVGIGIGVGGPQSAPAWESTQAWGRV